MREWYPNDEKLRKGKLGSLYECRMGDQSTLICRVMQFERISSYQVEGYFANVAKLNYLRLQDYILMPLGIHIEGENQVNLIVPQKLSLYEILHSGDRQLSL